MSQSRGTAPLVPSVGLSSKEFMDALEKNSALWEDLSRGMRTYHIETTEPTQLGGDRDEGYYGFCTRKRYRGQVLEKNNDTGLRSAVQKVADRYIKCPA